VLRGESQQLRSQSLQKKKDVTFLPCTKGQRGGDNGFLRQKNGNIILTKRVPLKGTENDVKKKRGGGVQTEPGKKGTRCNPIMVGIGGGGKREGAKGGWGVQKRAN